MTILLRASFVFTLLLVICCIVKATWNGDEVISFRNSFEQTFKFRPAINNPAAKPPKHMVQLHKMYSKGALQNALGDTVRSILPTTEGSVIIFNLIGIERAEDITLAQLLLHTQRLRQRRSPIDRQSALASPTRVILYQILPRKGTEKVHSAPLATLPVYSRMRDVWHSLNITEELREFLMDKHSSSLQLGMRFETIQHNAITPEHFLRTDKDSVYLVIFSNNKLDGNEQYRNQKLMKTKETTDNLVNIYTEHPLQVNSQIHNSNENDGNTRRNIRSTRNKNNNDNPNKLGRNNRDVNNNEASDLPQSEVSQTSPRSPPKTRQPTRVSTTPQPSTSEAPEVIPLPVVENCATEMSTKNSTNTLLDTEQTKTLLRPTKRRRFNSTGGRRSSTLQLDTPCQRRNMYVNFTVTGWSDWIVAPPGYEAYYCGGRCSFPWNEKGLKPTNHAIVQSIVQASRSQPEIPEPCCIPDELSILSILFMNEENHIILRNYKDMVVKSCVCR